MTNDITVSNLKGASYALLLVGLVAGIMGLAFNARTALLPAAIVFGWFQIGGL